MVNINTNHLLIPWTKVLGLVIRIISAIVLTISCGQVLMKKISALVEKNIWKLENNPYICKINKEKRIMKIKEVPKRRRAISAEVVRQSNQHPERFKYVFKVREVDGNISEIPQYGVDMEDALSSVMLRERAESITNVVSNTPDWMLIGSWAVVFAGGVAIVSQLGFYQEFVITVLGVTGIATGIGFFIKRKIDKRSIEENE